MKDDSTGDWGVWEDVGEPLGQYDSGGWSVKDVELTGYAGQTVRIGFLHVADPPYERQGWYIDDIRIAKKVPEVTGDFEMGWVDWSASNGVWQVGEPTSGPGACYQGERCAGTVLDSKYPPYSDSRLVSAPIDFSSCSPSVVYLSFWEWFSYSSHDYGEVQISIWDTDADQWSDWESLSAESIGISPAWTHKYVDLSIYSGKVFRVGFLHEADPPYESRGWFIDNLELVGPTKIMPTIDSISFTAYIPVCTSLINVSASDPCGGELTYIWQIPDGGTLVGTGSNMEFVPPEIRIEPYRVRVAVTSNLTQISSFTKTLKIYTQVLYDLNDDNDIDGSDLFDFISTEDMSPTTIARFAEEFGMIACEQ